MKRRDAKPGLCPNPSEIRTGRDEWRALSWLRALQPVDKPLMTTAAKVDY